MPVAVVLFSGGLDSMLSVRVMQAQGFDVEALNIRTIYSCCQATSARTATALGARLTVTSVADDYLEVIRNPSYGYGKAVNPCVDCRIYMCQMAGRLMKQIGASVVVTGEIVGQRPMSQKRHQLDLIARRSGLEGRLLRPLSAKLLKPTDVELQGLVNRQELYDFNGRGRRKLIELAERLGVAEPDSGELPTPSTGCALTEPSFAPRVRDLMQFNPDAIRWDFELLSHGRHFRFDRRTKIVLGRNERENAFLQLLALRDDAPRAALLAPDDFRGPEALVTGEITDLAVRFAGALILRYAGRGDSAAVQVRIIQSGSHRVISVEPDAKAQSAAML